MSSIFLSNLLTSNYFGASVLIVRDQDSSGEEDERREDEMSGMQAVTMMEIEAVRRQEVLLGSARTVARGEAEEKRVLRTKVAGSLARLALTVTHAAVGALARI
jgi:hypothetical protein